MRSNNNKKKLCLLFPIRLSGAMWEKAIPESGSPALNAPQLLPWGRRVNSLWRGCEASRMTLLAWLTQRFPARSWVGGKGSPGDGGQVGPPHVHPQRLGAVDRLHHRVFGEKRSVTGYSSSLQSSLWSGSVSSPCTHPPAASPPETTPSVSPFDLLLSWLFQHPSRSVFGSGAFPSVDSPQGTTTTTRPRCWGKVPSHPCGGPFLQQGCCSAPQTAQNFFGILQKVVIIITCCQGDTVVGDSPKLVNEQNQTYKILHPENLNYFLFLEN